MLVGIRKQTFEIKTSRPLKTPVWPKQMFVTSDHLTRADLFNTRSPEALRQRGIYSLKLYIKRNNNHSFDVLQEYLWGSLRTISLTNCSPLDYFLLFSIKKIIDLFIF